VQAPVGGVGGMRDQGVRIEQHIGLADNGRQRRSSVVRNREPTRALARCRAPDREDGSRWPP
jgi:hypothetical protein